MTLYWPCENPGEFLKGSMVDGFEKLNKKWQKREEPRYNASLQYLEIVDIITLAIDLNAFKYGCGLANLMYLIEKGQQMYSSSLDNHMLIAFKYGDYEISRELALRLLKFSSKSDLRNSGKEYIELIKEGKNIHILDILGMVLDEINRKKSLTEEEYDRLLRDFKEPLIVWREYEVPKCKAEGCYETMKQIEELCFKYEAYETCLRLSGVLFIAGTEPQEHFIETLFFIAKVAYENGYDEIARQCFAYVDAETEQKCWDEESEKYKFILEKDTRMIVPPEAYEIDQIIEEKVERGEIFLYTEDEVIQYINEEMPKAIRKQKKELKQREQIKVAVQEQYNKITRTSIEEMLTEIEKLLEILGETDNRCLFAATLYRRQGELYLEQGKEDASLESFKTAYACENGRFDAELMKDFAILAEKAGKKNEAAVYRFRAEILSVRE